jgi:hypothetical protein
LFILLLKSSLYIGLKGVQSVQILCIVYYETRKRELKIRPMSEGQSDERLKTRVVDMSHIQWVFIGDPPEVCLFVNGSNKARVRG